MDDPRAHLPLSEPVFHILVSVAAADAHGYAIIQEVAARTGHRLRLSAGTLYSAIRRLLEAGLITEVPSKLTTDDERRRYYRITPAGRAVVQAELKRLEDLLRQARKVNLRAAH